MDKRLLNLIKKFNAAQESAVSALEKCSISRPVSARDWVMKQQEVAEATKRAGIKVFPHGCGLSIAFNDTWIDFDFGENGEINGFDAYRLWSFAERNKIQHGFESYKEVEAAIEQAVGKELIRFSGYINYYLNA